VHALRVARDRGLEPQQYGSAARQCYSWLGPNQPGVNETDPSDPSACVPDPGGAPPGHTGPTTSATKCPAAALSTNAKKGNKATTPTAATGTTTSPSSPVPSTGVSPPSTPSVQNALGQVNKAVGAATGPLGGVTSSVPSVPVPSVPVPTQPQPQTSTPNNGAPSAQQAQQLLNYLLSP
jgi:hypothetical protein